MAVRCETRRHGMVLALSENGRSHDMANILIVDDDLDIVDVSKELLESAGYGIRVGHNGAEGMASLSGAPLPDCVLLDVDMPVLDGEGMAHQMLLHDAGEEKIPILLVSGRSDLRAVAARVGTPYFITKASAGYAEVLVKTIERALAERRAPTHA
jgi:CheY-like chemotaxis protein